MQVLHQHWIEYKWKIDIHLFITSPSWVLVMLNPHAWKSTLIVCLLIVEEFDFIGDVLQIWSLHPLFTSNLKLHTNLYSTSVIE